MRIIPNLSRLRVIALGCWVLSSWCIVYGGRLFAGHTATLLLMLCIALLGLLALAVGVAFWLLSSDRQAGITFDSKGMLLNLGHSSSFINWANIERVGVTSRRDSLLTIGSARQIGITLRDSQAYIQSYEDRLPATRGVLARGIGLLDTALRPWQRVSDAPIAARLAACHTQTGYHVLVPEALLGGSAAAFVELIDMYRLQPAERRMLENLAYAG
ncbi:MAG: hypothetical protein ABI901_17765 [Roseiflexaceae bacterium]